MNLEHVHNGSFQGSFDKIQAALQDSGLPLEDCRGQGYANGANLTGKVKGVQAQILKANPLTTYSTCTFHNLGLVAVHAAESCP